MQRTAGPLIAVLLLGCSRPPALPCECPEDPAPSRASEETTESPTAEDPACLRQILRARRSVRSFASRPLSREDLLSLLWAAQGITDRTAAGRGLRAAPSAGARYPLELYVVVERVEGLEPGLYRYRPAENAIEPVGPAGHLSEGLAEAALGQGSVARAPATVVVAAELRRTAARYGSRAERYVLMEVGHASQNLLLMATALGLGACPIGAFEASEVQSLLELGEEPYSLIPVGPSRQ
jgi:SagB-type dehydrogenase family enzyme